MNPFNSNWFNELSSDEQNFIFRFIILSGSLKDLASHYEVTYPTVRLRLDKLISKIDYIENSREDTYINLIKNLTLDEKIPINTAKTLIYEYKKTKGEK